VNYILLQFQIDSFQIETSKIFCPQKFLNEKNKIEEFLQNTRICADLNFNTLNMNLLQIVGNKVVYNL